MTNTIQKPTAVQELCGEIGAFNFAQLVAAEASERLRPIFADYVGKQICKQDGGLLKRVADNPDLVSTLAYLKSRRNYTATYGNSSVQWLLLSCDYGKLRCEVSATTSLADRGFYYRQSFDIGKVDTPCPYGTKSGTNKLVALCEEPTFHRQVKADEVIAEAIKIESLRKQINDTRKLTGIFGERTVANAIRHQ